jgi:hypothetical protein
VGGFFHEIGRTAGLVDLVLDGTGVHLDCEELQLLEEIKGVFSRFESDVESLAAPSLDLARLRVHIEHHLFRIRSFHIVFLNRPEDAQGNRETVMESHFSSLTTGHESLEAEIDTFLR